MSEPWKTHGPDFNAWNDDLDQFIGLLNSVKDKPWWVVDIALKYLDIRIDTRDNGWILRIEDSKERISPDRVVAAIAKYHDRFGTKATPPAERKNAP